MVYRSETQTEATEKLKRVAHCADYIFTRFLQTVCEKRLLLSSCSGHQTNFREIYLEFLRTFLNTLPFFLVRIG